MTNFSILISTVRTSCLNKRTTVVFFLSSTHEFNANTVRFLINLSFRVSRSASPTVASAGVLVALLAAYSILDELPWSSIGTIWSVIVAGLFVSRPESPPLRKSRPFVENVLVLGETELAHAVIAELKKRSRYRVLDTAAKRGLECIFEANPFSQTDEQPHRIVVALHERRGLVPTEALLDAKRKGIVIEDGLHMFERLSGKLAVNRVYPSHLIYLHGLRRSLIHGALQRVMSIVLSAVGLVLCAPLFAVIALLIKLDSPGPVFFVQQRIGKDARRFPVVKFRTMRSVAARTSEWVKDNGDRITRVGRWLRKFRVDEVPQLINVLLGHMNLVGPRPHPASNYALFMDRIPFYAFRSMVLPGITGWAQVRYGYANSLEEETEKMSYDLYYIKHASLWFDLRILFRTILVVILGQELRQTNPKQAQASHPDVGTDRRLDAA